MANGFDRKGAVIGVGLLVLFVLLGAAVLIPFTHPLSISVKLPPAHRPQ